MPYTINNMMSPAVGGAGGGNHAESSPSIPLQRGTEWIPIFKTGTHTNSAGNEKTWTEAELDQIAASYSPDQHEAPIVIGHPEHNSPAWGWVEGLKRDGRILYAKFKDLVPEFVDMVRRGLFKKRSISLYPDGTLRHVGFLGAMPPAVKGLPDVAFQDSDGITIEFGDCQTCKGCNQIHNFCGKEQKPMKWFEWMKKKASDEGVTLDDVPANYSAMNPPPAPASGGQGMGASGGQYVPPAGDIEAEVTKRVKAKELEFAEAQKTLDAEKARLKAESDKLAQAKAEKVKADIRDFCEGLCKEGRITPAMLKHGIGMQAFLESIAGVETRYEFCEPTPDSSREGKTQTPFEYMKSFLSGFRKQIEFGEFAGADKDTGRGNASEKLAALTKQKMQGNKELTYRQAFSEVQQENRELAMEYAAEIR